MEKISLSFSTHFLPDFGGFSHFFDVLALRFDDDRNDLRRSFLLKASSNIGLSNQAIVWGGSKTLLSYKLFKKSFLKAPLSNFYKRTGTSKGIFKCEHGYCL